MEILFLFGAAQAFFFGLLLLGKGNSGQHHKLLFSYFGIIGFVLIGHFLFIKGIVFSYPHLLGLTYTLPVIIGPILFFYTKALIGKKDFQVFPELLIHAIPFFGLILYFTIDFYFLSPQEKLLYFERESHGETSLAVYIAEIFINFSIPVYSIASLLLLKNHLEQIKQCFSSTQEVALRWLKVVLGCMVFLSFVSVLMGLLSDYFNFIDYQDGDNVMYLSLTIVIYILGYYGIRQQPVFSKINTLYEFEIPQNKKPKYANSSLKKNEKERLIHSLTNYMEKEKPYLDEALTLNDLAAKLEILPNNLSQLINESLDKNFYEFVNEYRVNEVKRMLSDSNYSHYSLLGIGLECGFSSKSTFNSVFKQHTGKTPSEYRKSFS